MKLLSLRDIMQCNKGQIVLVRGWEHTTYKVKFIKKENKKRTVVEFFFQKCKKSQIKEAPDSLHWKE